MDLRRGSCGTSAGETVAFATVGRGSALLVDFGWLSHFEQAWQFAPYRAFIERLASARTVVLHDKPGFGSSAGAATLLTLEAGAGVIAALADHLKLKRFDLLGALQAGPMAVAYAAAHRDRVGRLILYGTYGIGRDMAGPQLQASLLSLIRAHWGVGSQTLADLWMPEADAAGSEWFARYQRQSAGAELAAAAIESCYTFDVTRAAATITAPTLVLHRRGDRAVPIRLGWDLAGMIPGAKFVALEGRSHLPFVGDPEPLLRAVLRFLGVATREIAAGAPPRLSSRETEVAAMVTQGLSNAEIAQRLGIAQRTAEAHVENIRRKFGLRSRAQIAAGIARAT